MGGKLEGLLVLQVSGILFLYVCCGLYGGKEIDILLKMWSICQLNYKHPSLVLSMSGLLLWVHKVILLNLS